MAKKEKPQEQGPQAAPKKPPKGNGGILLPVLFAAIVGFACFLIILGVGGMVSEHNAQTADAPSAQPSSLEALPTQRPTNAPTQETVGSEEPVLPDETDEPTATDPPQDLPRTLQCRRRHQQAPRLHRRRQTRQRPRKRLHSLFRHVRQQHRTLARWFRSSPQHRPHRRCSKRNGPHNRHKPQRKRGIRAAREEINPHTRETTGWRERSSGQ